MDLSAVNKTLIIDELLREIKTTFHYRTDEPEKCQRDLEHIYDAVVNDYLENSDYYISIIANKFWYMNVRQIKRFAVEFKIYELLETKLIESGAEKDRLSKIFDTLKNIIEHGPNETAESSLNVAASGARRCQRNWDYSKSVAKKDVISLTDIAITMPAKQARTYFELIVSTDQELNNFIRKNNLNISVIRFESVVRIIFSKKIPKDRLQRDILEKKNNSKRVKFINYLIRKNIIFPSNGIIFLNTSFSLKEINNLTDKIGFGLKKFFS